MHYLLTYQLCADYLTRRAEFRKQHLALAWQSVERGELLLGGPMADPADAAMLLFQADSAEVPEAFAEADPYVIHGLVTQWHVRRWNTVVGHDADVPTLTA